MTFATHDPDTVPDLGIPTFTQGLMLEGVRDWFIMSGQIGLKPDGTLAGRDTETQIRQAFANIANLLADAGLSLDDLVFLRFYLTKAADIPAMRTLRNEFLGTRKVPSTLLVISALANPDWTVEIEAVAARR
ncbi:MAG: RidA family protein [Alphaproteobacteria bacterium]|nr:RidA family protein [Alphaproteobacteria bacterium]